jgi:hypothetical protein
MSVRHVRSEYRQCRTWGHWMQDFIPGPGEYHGPGWGRTFAAMCTRCGTRRFTTIDSLGQIGHRRYIHPDGYKVEPGLAPTKAQLRNAYMRELRTQRDARVRRRGLHAV